MLQSQTMIFRHIVLVVISLWIVLILVDQKAWVVNGSDINAELGKSYQVDPNNSHHPDGNNSTLISDQYIYSEIHTITNFDKLELNYEYVLDQEQGQGNNFTFKVGKLVSLLYFQFDFSRVGQVERMFLKFSTVSGIFNRDVSQMNVTIAGDGTVEHILSVTGDSLGKLTRDCTSLKIELFNLTQALSMGENGNRFYLVLEPNSRPEPKEISLNEWNNVMYPSSYTLQTGTTWNRLITLSFPKQLPVCSDSFPQFQLTSVSDVDTKDIVDERFKDDLVVVRAYMYNSDNSLITADSTFKFWYQFSTIKDISGKQVEIQTDTLTCGTTNGHGYKLGTRISPIIPTSNNDGEMICGDSLYSNNSLIVIYGKIKKVIPPKPFIGTLSDGTSLYGEVSSGTEVYMLATTHDDTCISLSGTVSENPLAIYMLQQKSSIENPILPTKTSFSDMAIAPVGSISVKFCSNDTVSNEINADTQQMVFLFTTTSNSTSKYSFYSSLQPYWRVPVIIGVCVGGVLVLLIVFLTAIGFWLCTRKKKYAYNYIQ